MGILIKDILTILPDIERGFGVRQSCVYIEGDIIAGVGIKPPSFEEDKVIDGRDKLLIPGLINSHTHAYMTILRNLADDLMFHDWLFGNILPTEDKLTEEDAYWGTMLGCMEMLRFGTTCFSDMYIFTGSAARAACDCQIRAVLSRGLTGGESDKAGGARRLNEALSEISAWKDRENLSFMLAPHAVYTCDFEYLHEIGTLAKEMRLGIHTHLSESIDEVADCVAEYGISPVELMDKAGLLGENTLAAHCVHLTPADIELLAARDTSVCTNPVSNLKLANGVAPVPRLIDAGVNVCLGTDGAASNNSLNMFRDLSMLTLIHKGVSRDALAVSAGTGLAAATVNGARALGLHGITGEIKVGLKADLVILGMTEPNMRPVNNPLAALSYSANGSEVETVIVGGKILLEKGQYKTIDAERVYFEIEKIRQKLGIGIGYK